MHSNPMNNIVNELISSYIDAFYEEPDDDLLELRSFAEEHYVPIILKDTEELLRLLLAMHKPTRILEIGTAIGYSACFFARTCPDCRITTIERDEDLYRTAVSNLKQLGCADRIDCICGEASQVLKELGEKIKDPETEGYDFVFIDASKSHYLEFWELCLPLVTDDAVIICDNVLMKGMTAYKVDLKLPRYETSSDTDNLENGLQGLLENLGIRQVFNPQCMDIVNMCDRPVYVNMIRQKAMIKVNEEGTEAAAVTASGVLGGAAVDLTPRATFHANRPFVYVIRELSSGVILFVGKFTGE